MKMKRLSLALAFTLAAAIFTSCEKNSTYKLPILGYTDYEEVNGKVDTIYHTIPAFGFLDQDSAMVTKETVEGKIYVADFFFGTCPTICPKMAQQMLRVYDQFKDNEDFAILSHTIDPEHDTVEYLNGYAAKLGVNDNETWHFLTGKKEEIYELGTAAGYMVQVREDPTAEGGYIHSGAFILVDKEGRVRGFYDGTIPEKVDVLMNDIKILQAEYAD